MADLNKKTKYLDYVCFTYKEETLKLEPENVAERYRNCLACVQALLQTPAVKK